MKKRVATSVFLVVGAAIALIVGVWVVSLVLNSISLPTNSNSVVNETITFAVNNTYYNFANQALCLDDTPLPINCGVTAIVSVGNETTAVTAANYVYTTNQIKIYTIDDGTIAVGKYNVSYTWYDYTNTNGGNALQTAQTTTFNSFVLLAVGLIVVASTVIIGYFGFGKKK